MNGTEWIIRQLRWRDMTVGALKRKLTASPARSRAVCGGLRRPPGAHPLFHLVSWLILIGLLIGSGNRIFHSWKPVAATIDGVPELDSFSEPEIAASVLRQYANNLIWTSASRRNAEPPAGFELTAMAQNETTAIIGRIKEEIGRIEGNTALNDLQIELLMVYHKNRQWNEFVDCYLDLLGRSPGSGATLTWAATALDNSIYCHRTEEVYDALLHQARFHRKPGVAAIINGVLEQWSETHRQSQITKKV